MPMPPPRVPALEPENFIDLDKLGSLNLTTYIQYPGMSPGDYFWPNWRGCADTGEVVDFFDSLIEVPPGLGPEGMPLEVANVTVKALDQGWVFYSYQLEDVSTPDHRGEESLRRFFYVGQRATSGTALAVPQCKQSHDLFLDPDLLSGPDAQQVVIMVVPYRAMQAGDKVMLKLARFIDDSLEIDPILDEKTLKESDIGQPLLWEIDPAELLIIFDGFVLMTYSVEYADPTSVTVSAEQRLNISKPSTALLPAATIEGYSGGPLDPESYRDGVTLEIELYPGIQNRDDVLLYAIGDTTLVKHLTVDPSTIASGVLHLNVEYCWLLENTGKPVQFFYQYARVGAAGTSAPLEVLLRQPLYLPPPIVEGANPEDSAPGEYKGWITARAITSQVRVAVPDDAVIGGSDVVRMHWDGCGSTGSHIANPSVGNPKQFVIPGHAVPANMRKRVDVYYSVTPAGESPYLSKVFDLAIRPLDGGWPVIQIAVPDAPASGLPLPSVPEDGAVLELTSWTFFAEGQRVNIIATGLLPNGDEVTEPLRVGAAEAVTEDEYDDGLLSVILPRSFLARLELNKDLTITVETSFDEGNYYEQFLPNLAIKLVP